MKQSAQGVGPSMLLDATHGMRKRLSDRWYVRELGCSVTSLRATVGLTVGEVTSF